MNNMHSRSARTILIASLAALYIPAIYILCAQYYSPDSNDRGPSPIHVPDHTSTGNSNYGPRNSTLGFEKIFYISMPERTDRQDTMSLIASYMGLEFTMVPGVNGSTIPEKALPYDTHKKPVKAPNAAELGCWRAHANIWSHILTSGISTALILEDDIDFSTGIKDILENVSTHLQIMTGASGANKKNGDPEAPYGLVDSESWDVLSLGHCWNERPPAKTYPVASKIYQAWEDSLAPANDKYHYLLPSAKSARIRVLQPTYVVVCTQGYAVSQAGARRLLHHIGGPGGVLYEPLDLVMMNHFRDGKLKGYTATPSLFGQWKNGNGGDTDIQKQPENVEKGSGGDVINSVRREMGDVWNGRNIWKEIEAQGKISKRKRDRQRRWM